MQNQSFIVFSIFHLYISLIKAYELKKNDSGCETFLVLTDHTPGGEELFSKVKKLNVFDGYFFVHDSRAREEYPRQPAIKRFIFRKKLLETLFCPDISNDLVQALQNSEVNLFLDSTQFVQWMYYNFPNNFYRLYEDGERLYMVPKDGLGHWIKHNLLRYPKKHGRDKQIKEIMAQRVEELPLSIKHKAKIFSLHQITQLLSSDEKNEIIDLFIGDIAFDEITDEKKMLLITQPLSEDGYIEEGYKIDLYKRIISKFSKGYKVFIKPHPRETTDYNKLTNLDVLPRSFPLEILNYTGNLRFERGITLFSSAIKNAHFVDEKIFLGIDWDKEVADNFAFKTQA